MLRALNVTTCPARLHRPRSTRARWPHPTSCKALRRSAPARRECPQWQLSPTRWAQGQTWRRRIILTVQAGAGAVAVMVTVKGTPVRAPPAAQPQPSRPPPAPHSDCLCAIGRVVAASGIHDTGSGLRAQLEQKVLDPPGICGEEQTIPARRAAARRRFSDRCAPRQYHIRRRRIDF